MHVTNGHRIRRKVGIDLHKGTRPDMITSVETHTMTLTERNNKLYQLRKDLEAARLQVAWVETEIQAVRREYMEGLHGDRDLFQQMFGEPQTLWDHLDRLG